MVVVVDVSASSNNALVTLADRKAVLKDNLPIQILALLYLCGEINLISERTKHISATAITMPQNTPVESSKTSFTLGPRLAVKIGSCNIYVIDATTTPLASANNGEYLRNLPINKK